MQRKKSWVSILIFGFFSLFPALSILNCGSDDSSSLGADNTTSDPSADFSDYTFEEPDVTGKTFYIDPVNGSQDGDGSEADPWLTLQQVIEDGLIQWYQHAESDNPDSALIIVNDGAPVQGGDRLLLRNGYHGYIYLNTFIFKDWLTIAAQEGHMPVLAQINLQGAFEKFYLKGLTFLKESYEGTGNYWDADEINHTSGGFCLYLGSNNSWGIGRQVKLNELTIKTTTDASSWTAEDWVEKAAGGINLRNVLDCEIVNCHIENVRHGLSIDYASDNTIAVNNTIKYYSGDGCRLISSNVYLAYNTITDCLKVDDNHDDAIQSYTRVEENSTEEGILYNNVVRGNLIIGTTDFSHPLAASPQGIGCFDGFFDGWIVDNNVIIVDNYHGITFRGMRNSYILNNTVIAQNYGNSVSPWITIADHKNETPSENCIIANNIVYRSISALGTNVLEHHNYIVGKDNPTLPYDLFASPDNFDFHLRNNTITYENIIDQGVIFSDIISSVLDRDNAKRIGAPDLGAYEAE